MVQYDMDPAKLQLHLYQQKWLSPSLKAFFSAAKFAPMLYTLPLEGYMVSNNYLAR